MTKSCRLRFKMLRVGKHKGRTFREVSQCDRSYAAWVLREKNAPRVFCKFRHYLEQKHGGILQVGKYKDKYFEEVLRDSPDYCDWQALAEGARPQASAQ